MEYDDPILRLGVALSIGALIGVERGWHERGDPEGTRIAGIRTFAISGLLGGLWAMLTEWVDHIVLGFAFVTYAIVIIVARVRASAQTHDYGATTVVAALLTFALGALAVLGDMAIAASAAVITALLLGSKPTLHSWLTRIDYEELLAVLKLLVMTVVLLPVLPDKGYGPWQALNPYEMWLMVVLISGVSFVGYVIVKAFGARLGVLLAAGAGGLVSSTAVTLNFARLAQQNPGRERLLASGIVVASGMMFIRTTIIVFAIDSDVALLVAPSVAGAGLVCFVVAFVLWRSTGSDQNGTTPIIRNPFELGTALQFGALLAVIMLASRGLQANFGDTGIYLLACFSGIADTDAIALSLSRMANDILTAEVASIGVAIAVLTNTLVKAGIGMALGGRKMIAPIAIGMGAGIAAGAAVMVYRII